MTNAIRVHEYGGPEVMRFEGVDVGEPGPLEVRVKQQACGLNYIDVYHRTGFYPQPALPFVLGAEGAGDVVAVGADVSDFSIGDRVAYGSVIGGYAEERLIAADRLVKLPDAISYETAAAMMLQGMTARYLLKKTFPVKAGDTILYQAAAGGVGLILCQWANAIGATVIGTVGSEEKATLAKANGCHHTINYQTENFVEKVKEITDGKGVNVVYDGVGKDTFDGDLDCLKPRGLLAMFGQSSGAVPPFDLNILSKKGSLYLTRPTLFTHVASREDLVETANDLFEVVASGKVNISVNQRYALADAAEAHRDLEARKTSGSTVLLP